MTRETKIGLLVGLAFIIVIGILLSDHLTSTNEPTQAALVQAGPAVRQAVATPGGAVATVAPVTPPQQVAPQNPVPTREELTPPQPPVTVVQVGPAAGSTATQPSNTPNPNPAAPEQVATNTDNSTLEQVARTFNEQIVAVGTPTQPNTPTPPAVIATQTHSGQRQYKAEPGDSLSKIAAKFFGRSTATSRDLIIKANPTLQQDPNKVIVGRSYNIPGADGATAPALTVAQAPQPAQPTTSPEHTYTVKSGDTLTKIAVEQLGTADAISSILELNKDTLKNRDIIHPNMKLRLPAKPLAMAQ